MKAVVQNGYGSPDCLHLREVDTPTPGDDEVLVRIHAAAMNAFDIHLLRRAGHVASRLMGRPPSPIRGGDLAGVVEACGRNVTRFKPGDAVFGVARGTFAEYATTTEARLAFKPAALTFDQAAALPVAGCTALQGMRDKGRVQPGHRVLVYGAGGGTGTLGVLIAKAFGAHVTAVTRTANLDFVRSIGADAAIDYTREDFTRSAERYDVVFDVGADRPTADCMRLLTPTGRMVMVGAPTQVGALLRRILEATVPRPGGGRRPVLLAAKIRGEDLTALQELADAGKLCPPIDRTYALAEVRDAFRYLKSGRVQGKVVIHVADAGAA
jgi:NADPH:quinone reductase-like Zn-dependent oxidoreductase